MFLLVFAVSQLSFYVGQVALELYLIPLNWLMFLSLAHKQFSWLIFLIKLKMIVYHMEKLHFIILNYALDYTLHPKLSDCTLCTLKYHIYHTLHPCVIFAVIFNKILLHVTSTCFLLRWNKVKRLKHHYLIPIKKKTQSFPHLPLSHVGPSSSLDSPQLHLHCLLKKKKKNPRKSQSFSLIFLGHWQSSNLLL